MATSTIDLGDGRYLVSLPLLLKVFNPFEETPWDCEPITAEDVTRHIGDVEPIPYETRDRGYHIRRIAFLWKNGWSLEEDIPQIDLGVDFGIVPAYPLNDGNHRLAAAILRGDGHFLVEVSGDVDWIEEVLL